MKILIVDDRKDVRDTLSKMLTLEEHETVTAEGGQEGLEMIESGTFDAVLLDLQMPGLNGLQVIDALGKSGNIALNKIIVMTASAISSEELNALKKKGMFMWMRKPIDGKELGSILGSISSNGQSFRIEN